MSSRHLAGYLHQLWLTRSAKPKPTTNPVLNEQGAYSYPFGIRANSKFLVDRIFAGNAMLYANGDENSRNARISPVENMLYSQPLRITPTTHPSTMPSQYPIPISSEQVDNNRKKTTAAKRINNAPRRHLLFHLISSHSIPSIPSVSGV